MHLDPFEFAKPPLLCGASTVFSLFAGYTICLHNTTARFHTASDHIDIVFAPLHPSSIKLLSSFFFFSPALVARVINQPRRHTVIHFSSTVRDVQNLRQSLQHVQTRLVVPRHHWRFIHLIVGMSENPT